MKKSKTRYITVSHEPAWTPFEDVSLSPDQVAKYVSLPVRLVRNSRYTVHVYVWHTPLGEVTQLSIRRNDKQVFKDWRDMQRIKNELCGPEVEGVELYPSESRLCDTSNQFHIWCLPEGMVFPFGYHERLVTESGAMGSVQRPFEQKPADLASTEAVLRKVDEERERVRRESGMSTSDVGRLALAVPK